LDTEYYLQSVMQVVFSLLVHVQIMEMPRPISVYRVVTQHINAIVVLYPLMGVTIVETDLRQMEEIVPTGLLFQGLIHTAMLGEVGITFIMDPFVRLEVL